MAGIVVYEGPSLLTGEPVKVVLTGYNGEKASQNRKTGPMVQSYILTVAEKPDKQAAICGECPMKRACYVEWHKSVRSTWAHATKRVCLEEAPTYYLGRKLRLGAAGDPAAIPTNVWEMLLSRVKRWTGYTHQWSSCDPALAQYTMASVETVAGKQAANRRGFRTFRVIKEGGEPLQPDEILCPASKEGGMRTTCERCCLCQGASLKAKNIAIHEH